MVAVRARWARESDKEKAVMSKKTGKVDEGEMVQRAFAAELKGVMDAKSCVFGEQVIVPLNSNSNSNSNSMIRVMDAKSCVGRQRVDILKNSAL